MGRTVCDQCKWCVARGCNEHEDQTGHYVPPPRLATRPSPEIPAGLREALDQLRALREAIEFDAIPTLLIFAEDNSGVREVIAKLRRALAASQPRNEDRLDEKRLARALRDRWRLAAEALAALVREDYPGDLRLSEIAETWGTGLTPEHIEALASVEATLPTEVGLRFREEPPDVVEIEGA